MSVCAHARVRAHMHPPDGLMACLLYHLCLRRLCARLRLLFINNKRKSPVRLVSGTLVEIGDARNVDAVPFNSCVFDLVVNNGYKVHAHSPLDAP